MGDKFPNQEAEAPHWADPRTPVSPQVAAELTRAEVESVPITALARQNVNLRRAAALITGVYPGLVPFRAGMLRLPDFEIRNLDNLPLYASAAAYSRLDEQLETKAPTPRPLVEKALRITRKQWRKQVEVLQDRELLASGGLESLEGGIGRLALSQDINLLARVIESDLALFLRRTPITEEEVRLAKNQADWLRTEPTVRRQRRKPPTAASLHTLKAFTLLYRAYDEVRRAMAFLRWHEGDAHEYAPALTGAHLHHFAKAGGTK